MTYLDDDMEDGPSCSATPEEEAEYALYLQVRAHEEALRLASFMDDLCENREGIAKRESA